MTLLLAQFKSSENLCGQVIARFEVIGVDMSIVRELADTPSSGVNTVVRDCESERLYRRKDSAARSESDGCGSLFAR